MLYAIGRMGVIILFYSKHGEKMLATAKKCILCCVLTTKNKEGGRKLSEAMVCCGTDGSDVSTGACLPHLIMVIH